MRGNGRDYVLSNEEKMMNGMEIARKGETGEWRDRSELALARLGGWPGMGPGMD